MPFIVGETIGPYRIVEQRGQGGMATVFKAYHASLDRYVALKALHPAFKEDPNFLARFQREARVVAKLDHPNIVPIYDFSEHEGRPFLVMKFIEGETLKSRMTAGPVSQTFILDIVTYVGAALEYAHRQGILHRDVKPSNVLLTPDGQIYLADFGLARIAQAGESTMSSDMMLGTPQYISPEQAVGKKNLDDGTDIYSFGVMLYEMLVGRVPFSADTPYAVIHDHIYTPLPIPRQINPDLSEDIERLLMKALAKERADRFANVTVMVKEFKKALQEHIQATTLQPLPPLQAPAPVKDTPASAPLPAPLPPGGMATAGTMAVPAAAPGTVSSASIRPQSAPPETVAASRAADAPISSAVQGAAPVPARKPGFNKKWLLAIIPAGLLLLAICGIFTMGFLRNIAQATRQARSSEATQVAEIALKTPLPPTPGVEEDTPEAHLRAAISLFDNGKPDQAENEFKIALSMAGSDRSFLVHAAEEASRRGGWVQAGMAYVQFGLVDPANIPPELVEPMQEALFLAARDSSFAANINITDIRKFDPGMAEVTQARLYLYNGQDPAAFKLMQTFLDNNPGFHPAILEFGEIRLKSGTAAEKLIAAKELNDLNNNPAIPRWIRDQAREILKEYKR